MKLNSIFLAVLVSSAALSACSRAPKEEPPAPVVEEPPIQEEQLSEQPQYEIENNLPPAIGPDGVWEAEPELVFGGPVPKNRVGIDCDGIRFCKFSVKMTSSQVKNFLEKYYPYQVLEFNSIRNRYTVQREIREEFLSNDAVVPTLDKRIVRPKPGQEIQVVAAFKDNAYTFFYKSAFSFDEDDRNIKADYEAYRAKALPVLRKVIERKSLVGLTPEEVEIANQHDIVQHENEPLDEEILNQIAERLKEFDEAQAQPKSDSGVDESGLPQLQRVKL